MVKMWEQGEHLRSYDRAPCIRNGKEEVGVRKNAKPNVTASDASSDLNHDGCESSLTIANK